MGGEGTFLNHDLNGYGTTKQGGESYEGDFMHGQKHGRGIFSNRS